MIQLKDVNSPSDFNPNYSWSLLDQGLNVHACMDIDLYVAIFPLSFYNKLQLIITVFQLPLLQSFYLWQHFKPLETVLFHVLLKNEMLLNVSQFDRGQEGIPSHGG